MMRLKRLILQPSSTTSSASILRSRLFRHHDELPSIPMQHFAQKMSNRFLDIYQMGNKAAIEKERARLTDEMNRGYFADISELKQHGGKISAANKIIIPAMVAVKFPALEVNYSDGRSLTLPVRSNGGETDADRSDIPGASLLCLSFRASSQAMINSWSTPFHDSFIDSQNVRLYEVSLIDSWFLSLKPIKGLLLRVMRKSKASRRSDALQRQIVYSFGDHYYFRKELKILNLLTGYVFLLDRFGRIRWQGSGLATQEELSSLLSCTSILLEEK